VTRRRVLLDENITVQLRLWMPRVDAASVEFMGWKSVKNGELLRRARAEGFEVLVTADRVLARTPRSWTPLGCIFLTSTLTRRVRASADRIEAACLAILPSQVITIQV
jgi:predicted nuclease of predicted toxin-antitoxin system